MRRKWTRSPDSCGSGRVFTALLLLGALPGVVDSQARGIPTPAVYVREIHIDPILLSFDLDSAKFRQAVETVLRNVDRLADANASRPALDVALIVPRNLSGVNSEPRAWAQIEVGRNLMEAGSSKSLVWERSVDMPTYVTWRALVAAIEAAVLNAIKAYATPAGA
jgi:hypothetical protein